MRRAVRAARAVLAALAMVAWFVLVAGAAEPASAPQAGHQAASASKPAPASAPVKSAAPPVAKTEAPAHGEAAKTVAPPAGPAQPASSAAASKAAPKTTQPPLGDVVNRINAIMAQESASSKTASDQGSGAAKAAASDAGQVRQRPTTAAVPTTPPRALPKRDQPQSPRGVTLAWDEQIDPRRARRPDLGVRLIWPSRTP
jgi:hypothetical protein